MLTSKKESFIIKLRSQILRDIPGLKEEDLLILEKQYLSLHVYQYLSEIHVSQIRKLKTLINAAQRIIESPINILVPRVLQEHLYTIGDDLTPRLENYVNLLNQVIKNPLPRLSHDSSAYLVYLIEKYRTDYPAVLSSRGLRITLGNYLNYYIEARKASDRTIDHLPAPSLHRDTYANHFERNVNYATQIEDEIDECHAFMRDHIDLLINSQMRANPQFYWEHRDRP